MVTPTVTTNISSFERALDAYQDATHKDMADILNRAALNIAYRAASFTPKASPSAIRADLQRDPHLRYALTAIALKKRGVGALKSPQFAKAVEKFVSRRASSAAYLRSAYAKAVEDLGGTFRGSRFSGADGFANKARAKTLVADIVAILSQPDVRRAQGAETIGLQALDKAINFVANDMLTYAQQKLAATATAHSP